jgi:hypothetical protein
MLKALLSFSFIAFGLAALFFSTSRGVSEWIENVRTYPPNMDYWWAQPVSNWGDLAGMSYLEKIKKFREIKNCNFEPVTDSGDRNINLYLYGDSYVAEISKGAFANVNKFTLLFRLGSHRITLDPGKRNVLIIEMAERYVREKFSSRQLLVDQIVVNNFQPQMQQLVVKRKTSQPQDSSFGIWCLFNPNINHNLEYHLFNYRFLMLPREVKAMINYEFFNRASGDVVISENGNYLFYKPTVVSNDLRSSYDFLSSVELDTLVNSLNEVYMNFRQAGFDEVYLSIIPNTVTILQPQPYNQLIPLLESNPRVKMPTIDIYHVFEQHKEPSTLFRAGDTHWNNNGLQLWLQKINAVLIRESIKAKQ